MAKLKYVIRYLVKNYPFKNELSKTRVTKMVYLADWFSAVETGKQITSINWYFDHYGPFVNDVYETIKKDKKLSIYLTTNAYGNAKELIKYKKTSSDSENYKYPDLNDSNKVILNTVIEETQSLNWTDFINYIYSTYPIKNSEKYTQLDLIKLSNEHKNIVQ